MKREKIDFPGIVDRKNYFSLLVMVLLTFYYIQVTSTVRVAWSYSWIERKYIIYVILDWMDPFYDSLHKYYSIKFLSYFFYLLSDWVPEAIISSKLIFCSLLESLHAVKFSIFFACRLKFLCSSQRCKFLSLRQ